MKTKFKVVALLLVVAMMASACGSGSKNKDGDMPTITLMFGSSTTDADTTPWYKPYIEKTLGIKIEYLLGGNVDALMATRDFPDLVWLNDDNKINIGVQAKMFLNLDKHKKDLPSVFENDVYKVGLEYSRDVLSGGTGDLYALPNLVGLDSRVGGNPRIRWDMYKEMGYPKVNNWDELLDLLKKMQDKYPKTADGLPTYGISLFKNWDANYCYPTWGYYGYFNGINKDVNALFEIKADASSDLKYKMDDDSDYKAALKFFFKANQLGILDPDSATQTNANATTKVNNGQVIWSPKIGASGYNTDEHINATKWSGYAEWWPDFMVQIYNGNHIAGNPGTYKLCVNAESENLDAALKFVDWFYSWEGNELWWNGPEGVVWDYDENGKKIPNNNYYNGGGTSYQFPEGGTVVSQQMLNLIVPMSPGVINPETKQEVNIFLSDVMKPAKTDKMMQDWYAHNGQYMDALAKRKAEGGKLMDKALAFSFIPAMGDEEKSLTNTIGSLVVQASWKMIFAKDEKEFEALWDQLQADAEKAGVSKVKELVNARWKDACDKAAKYTK